MSIYKHIIDSVTQKKKLLSILIDPDKTGPEQTEKIADISSNSGVDFFFVGGSLLMNNNLDECVVTLKENSEKPVIIFPGNTMQISQLADAILFLSLISGRNAEMLIGQHVIAAPQLRKTDMEIISTGYMLIDCGRPTSVSYMSNSLPIPYDKDDIAMCTAMAGEMLGLKLIYLEAGSGAEKHVSISMIEKVKKNISLPLIVGGGIRSTAQAKEIYDAGADMIIIGNAVEQRHTFITDLIKLKSGF